MSAIAAGTWADLARAAARGRDRLDPAPRRQLLAFQVSGDAYALPVERVRGISRLRPVTPVPRAPAEMSGVVSLRGEMVQLIDLARRLGLEPAPAQRRSRIVVAFAGDGVAGLRVDAVNEVLRVSEDEIRPADGDADLVESLCVLGGRFVSLLDLDRVLDLDGG